MDPAANADKETRRLRRTMRDLVALSTLPAVWIGLGPEGIARSLADALLNILSLDLIYVRLADAAGAGVDEAVRSKRGPGPPDLEAVRRALAPVLTAGRAESPATIADPSGAGILHVAVTRFGIGDDQGVLVACSCNADFPTEQDRVLLGVGASQTAIVVQRRRAEERLQAQQEWLRVTLASIGDAVIATDTAGRVTFLNSVAELLTGWTPADAQGKPLEQVFAIHNERTGQPVENPVEKVLREGVTVGLANHTVLIAKNGTARPIDDSAAPIRDAAGKLMGVVLIFRDVTDQRRAEQEVRSSEARKSAILETALDCIITMDHEGKVIEFNPAAEKTFGYRHQDVVGRELAGLIIPAPLRERHRKGLAHYLATGAGPVLGQRLELTALHADGSEFPVELAITRIPTQGPPLFTAYLRDITERKRVEQHRTARLAVTHVLTQARTVQEAASGVLQAVCESLGWDVGFFWTLDEDKHALLCRHSWHRSDATVTAFETASCNCTFQIGEGLPGRVWATSEPVWLLDVTREPSFPRAASAATEGLHSAFACPIAVGNRLLGVIEFFTTRIREADPDLLEMMATMAGAVGQFMERAQAEQGLRETVEHLRAVVETTPACIKIVSADGTLLDMSSAGLAMVGADSLEQVQGQCVYDLISEEHRAAFKAFNERICRGASETFEFDILSLQGARRSMETHAAPLRGADGRFRQLAITQDITERKRAEQDLRLQARVLESMAEGVSLLDEKGIIVYTNPAEDHIFGYEAGELIGQHVSVQSTCSSEEDLPFVAEIIERLEREGVWSGQLSNRKKDGSHFTTYARITALETGASRYFVCVQEDITERERVRTELHDARARLEAALEAGAIVTWTWDIVTNRLFADANLARLFGLTASDAQGGLLEKYFESIHPDDRTKVTAALERSVETAEDYKADYRIMQPDGSVRWVAARGRAERDEAGRAVRMPGVLVDITDRKRLEEELRLRVKQLAEADRFKEQLLASLRESEEKLRLLADTIPQLAWMARPDGYIFWYNRRWYEYTGTTFSQMEGWGWQSAHDPNTRPKVLERWQAAIASGSPFEMVFPLKGADGRFRPFLTRVNPLRDENGCILYWFGTNTDISDIKRMEEALREADRRKDEFLATLAHELRNPLAPIRMGLEVMKLAKDEPATVEATLHTMERQTQQLIALVDDLLDVSRITRGRLELRKCRVNLSDVLQSAVEASKPFIAEADHDLVITVPEHSIYLEADPHRLAQVVSNLLNNAAKYTPDGGRIWLTVERHGGDVVVSVKDNGIGIPAGMLDRIFEMFAQVDRPMEKSYTGLGIGLTLVKSLVEMHGGRIEVHSDGGNRGSDFRVRLPILPELSSGEPKSMQSGTLAHAKSKRRVLVVDDNRAAADMLGMVVRMLGNEVLTADDGQQAIDVAAQFLPHVILMDLGMPKLSGYEAARHIRQQPWGETMMLVALTGWGQDEDKQRTKEAGFDHHLVKPAEPSDLQKLLSLADEHPF